MPAGQSAGGSSSVEAPFPQVTLICGKSTFKPAITEGKQLLVQYFIFISKFTLLFWLLIYLDRDMHPLSIIFMYLYKKAW